MANSTSETNWKLQKLIVDSKGKIACNVDLEDVLENTLFSFKYW